MIDPKTTMLDFIDKEIVEDFTYQLRDRNPLCLPRLPVPRRRYSWHSTGLQPLPTL